MVTTKLTSIGASETAEATPKKISLLKQKKTLIIS
jgi:hypothetical protein